MQVYLNADNLRKSLKLLQAEAGEFRQNFQRRYRANALYTLCVIRPTE